MRVRVACGIVVRRCKMARRDMDTQCTAVIDALLAVSWSPGACGLQGTTSDVSRGEWTHVGVCARTNCVHVRVLDATGQCARCFTRDASNHEPAAAATLLEMRWEEADGESLGSISLPCGANVQLSVSRTGFVHVFVSDARGKFLRGYVKDTAGKIVGPFYRD